MRLFLEHPDSSLEELSSFIEVATGAGYSTSVGTGREVSLSMDPSKVESPPDLAVKLNAVLEGGAGTAQGVAYTFLAEWGGASGYGKYCLATLNVVGSYLGNISVLGSECSQVGLFASGDTPGGDPGAGRGTPITQNGLHLLDTCAPCVDCANFNDVNMMVDKLEIALDAMATDMGGVSGGAYGLFYQYQAACQYWNYLAHMTSIKVGADFTAGMEDMTRITAETSYVNWSASGCSPSVVIEVERTAGPVSGDVSLLSWDYRQARDPHGATSATVTKAADNISFAALALGSGDMWTVQVAGDKTFIPENCEYTVRFIWSGLAFLGVGESVTIIRKIYTFEERGSNPDGE